MTKINNYIDKNIINIISLFLILNPVIDVVTSLQIHFTSASLSIGMFFKILFLFILGYYHVFIKRLSNKKLITYLFIMFIYVVLGLLLVNGLTFNNLAGTFRIMFFPLSLAMCYVIFKEKRTLVNDKTIRLVTFIYAFLIILPAFTNTAFDSYAVAKKGSLGWFNAANEISAIIAITLPLMFYNLFNRFKIYKLLVLLTIIIATFIIGTKTPLVSLLLCTVIAFVKMVIKWFKKDKKKTILMVLVFFVAGLFFSITVIPKTNIYKNTVIHLEYLKIEKASDLFNYKTMDHFIFGRRLTFLEDNHDKYAASSVPIKFFGMGFESDDKLVEMDFFDVFYRTGIIGFVIFLLPILMILKDYKNFNRKYALSVFMILFSSVLAGHVLTAPSVSIVVTVILANALLSSTAKKRIIITAYDLGYGGIERALVTLLNNFNYDNYLVSLVLEKKRGVFLDELNPNVRILSYRVSDNKNVLLRKIINFLRQIGWIITYGSAYETGITYATYSLPGSFVTRTSADNTILYVHSNYYLAYGKDKRKVRNFFDGLKIRAYDYVVFVSNEAKNDTCHLYPEIENKAVTINNLVDYQRINKLALKTAEVNKKDNFVFLFVGRLDEASKQITKLLEVAKKCKQNKVKADFWLVGEGPDESRCLKYVKENKLNNVTFFGPKKNPYPYLNACDYLILTSKYEGFPVVYNEAIVLNKPIITTVDVSDDYVSIPNRFGFVVKDEVAQIYDCVKQLTAHPWRIKEKVNFESINKKRLKLLEKLMERNNG